MKHSEYLRPMDKNTVEQKIEALRQGIHTQMKMSIPRSVVKEMIEQLLSMIRTYHTIAGHNGYPHECMGSICKKWQDTVDKALGYYGF